MTPEEQARQSIDRQLDACGWVVQDRKKVNFCAGNPCVPNEGRFRK